MALIWLVLLWDYHEATAAVAFSSRSKAEEWTAWANKRLATKLAPHQDPRKVFWQTESAPTRLDDPTYPNHPL